MKCALLSNVNVESSARRIERHKVHIAHGYGIWTQELALAPVRIVSDHPASSWSSTEEVSAGPQGTGSSACEPDERLTWIEEAAERSPEIKFLVSTIDVPARVLLPLKEERIERHLEQHCQAGVARANARYANVYVSGRSLGGLLRQALVSWGLPFSALGVKLIAREIERILSTQVAARKKYLLVDLDNTLWGGIIGEDEIKGIQLSETGEGARYRDFQLRIRELSQMGVLLGIVSKNNEADVFEAFEKHEHMVLRKDDFATMKINWSPKAESIAELAQDLDIGMDSIVFIDDNQVERDVVRTALPEVSVPEFSGDTSELSAFFERVYKDFFFTLECTEEDRKRSESYSANAKRAAERTAASSIDDLLAGLDTKIVFTRASDQDFSRAAQLTQKPNQFNLTTRRYTEQELRVLQSTRDADVFIASITDKHGDNAKLCVGIVRRAAPDTAELDTFLMSCRVVGSLTEDQILDHVIKEVRSEGLSKFRVRFIPTRKNALAHAFVERLRDGRLVAAEESGARTWEFDIVNASPGTKPPYTELLTQPVRFSKVLS